MKKTFAIRGVLDGIFFIFNTIQMANGLIIIKEQVDVFASAFFLE